MILTGRSAVPAMCTTIAVVTALGFGLEARQPKTLPAGAWTATAAFYRQQILDSGIVGSSLVVVRDGRVAAEEYVGFQDFDAKQPVDRDTIYHWASITKRHQEHPDAARHA